MFRNCPIYVLLYISAVQWGRGGFIVSRSLLFWRRKEILVLDENNKDKKKQQQQS
jgi:hypothetical protein